MDPRRETRLTVALIAACIVLAAAQAVPRLHARRTVPVPSTPDLEVAVTGEVVAPGRYRLAWGARVGDLVEAAGGFVPGAARTLVDPAAPLVDGMRVHVPTLARRDGASGRVSLNAASAAELDALPGIGPALAARIVAARPFHDVDDLLRVRGIGPATLRRLRDDVGL